MLHRNVAKKQMSSTPAAGKHQKTSKHIAKTTKTTKTAVRVVVRIGVKITK